MYHIKMKINLPIAFIFLCIVYTSLSGRGDHEEDVEPQERTHHMEKFGDKVKLAFKEESVLKRLVGNLQKKHTISSTATKHLPSDELEQKRKQGVTKGHIFDQPEAKVIKPEQKKRVQGENMDDILTEKDNDKKRNFISESYRYWTKGIIPFLIDSVYDAAQVATIYEAISIFDELTCVRWVPLEDPRNTYENLGHTSYVKIVNGDGCNSYVGNQYYEYQILKLSIPGCVHIPQILHEMMHAMGSHHEQSRSDRDNYMDILYQNIDPDKYYIFKKVDTTDLNPYDASSVMQYGITVFNFNGGQTMRFKNHALEFLTKLGKNLTFYDVMDVNTAYNCSASCPAKHCQNAGFVNWKCECYCPDLLTGPLCEQTVGNCGGVIDVSAGQEVYITTPNYPNNYDAGLQCTWLLQGEPNNILRGTIVDMEINNNLECNHWMEIRFNLLGQLGPKRCGETTHEVWDASTDEYMNKVIINFDSFVGSDEPTSRGFKMKFESIGTGCVSHPCQFGSCYSPVNTDTYVCTCDTGSTGINCTELTDSSLVGCTAENGEYCILKQEEQSDDFDFFFGSQTTHNRYTGPRNAKQGFEYLYTRAADPRLQGDRAVLYTDVTLPSVDRCLRFFYHMYGSDMGTLNVYKSDSNGVETNIFSKTGNLGNHWIEAEIFIPAVDGLKIKFEGIIGGGADSDLAIDDVWLVPGKCAIDKTSIKSMACDFEADEEDCLFENVIDYDIDVFDWTRQMGSTSSSTGPNSAFNGQYYMYTETTSRVPGNSAVLHTYRFQLPASALCMELSYHMHGSSGSIIVSAGERFGTLNEIFSITGYQGNEWKTTQVNIPQYSDTVIQIKGTIDADVIALDNIKLNLGKCKPCALLPCQNNGQCASNVAKNIFTCTCTCGFTGQRCDLQDRSNGATFFCDFEDNENGCVFTNSSNDVFDWTRNSEKTPTPLTGPDNALSGLYYMYIETSSPRDTGDNAIMDTSAFKLPANSPLCMQYGYHMYSNPGDLIVKAGERGSALSEINRFSGNQGDQWYTSTVSIPVYSDTVISIEATNGSDNYGDISVDLIILQKGSCTDPCGSFPCLNGGSCTNVQTNYVCSCPDLFVGDWCHIIDKTEEIEFSCKFEDEIEDCIFEDSNNDVFDWTRKTGSTTSSGTGPSQAFEGTYYTYTEASSRVEGDYAILDTSHYKLADSSFCMEFAYHMYGSPGSLTVSAGERDGTMNEISSVSGDQGDQWITTKMTVQQYSDPVIQIVGTIGSSSKGDIAVDNITLNLGNCGDPCALSAACHNNAQCIPNVVEGTFSCLCTSGFTGQLCELQDQTSGLTFTCDFEDNENRCVFTDTNDDVFNWTRAIEKTPTSYTGPDAAFSGVYYMYIETSSPRDTGDNAILDTSAFQLPGNSPFCMKYAYHMYSNPGDLIISAGERGTALSAVQRFSGNQAEEWHTSIGQIPSFSDAIISIEATRGSDNYGDIGVDKVLLQRGLCTDPCGSFPCFNGGECSNDGTSYVCHCLSGFLGDQCHMIDKSQGTEFICNFENENEDCIFEESDNDVFDWTRETGSTSSSGTGPTQAFAGSYYKYTEASSPRVEGDYAILDTSKYKLPVSSMCIQFAYHMYGSPGSLIIFAGERNGNLDDIFTVFGDNGDQWVTHGVDILAFNDVIIFIKSTRGSSSKGDTAIDDIRLKVGTCNPV